MEPIEFRLNPNLDIKKYKADFARDGVVRVSDLFPEQLAEKVHDVLLNLTPWHMVHANAEGRHQHYSPEEWNSLPPAKRQQTVNEVMQRARDGFSYYYLFYPMIRAYLEKKDPSWPLHSLTEFLNSDEMLGFVKEVTSNPGGKLLDGQATFYGRGHFLNTHDDTGHDAERLAAYVMGFSKNWRTDWGGHLLFLDDGDVKRGFIPSFNSLTLFKVPTQHIVTQVTNFAGAGRYSVTGWLRKDT